MIEIKQILLPTDFSECSRQALTYALSFARRYKAKLILLHVIEAEEYIAYAEESASESSPDLREKIIRAMEESARESFNQFLKNQKEYLKLENPIYFKTATYGHFGRTDIVFPWENIVDLYK